VFIPRLLVRVGGFLILTNMKYDKSNPLRVFEAFGGYGSQSLALQRLKNDYPQFDFKVVGYSDIEPAAIKAYMALHEGEGVKNYGDICEIDWSQTPDFDLFTYSFPCFCADTLVLTSTGYKKIQDVEIGDEVMTHQNRYRAVTTTMQRDYSGIMVRLRGMGMDEIYCTAEHPFYIRRRYRKGHKQVRCFTTPEWVKAKDINKNCFLGYAINTKSELPKWGGSIDNRWGHGRNVNHLDCLFKNRWFWYVMGRYVGDGWKVASKTGNRIVICCSERNKSSLENALQECGFHFVTSEERTVTKIHICMNELYDFVERYGYTAKGKHIDAETLNLPVDLLGGFLDGYVDSDGCNIDKYYKVTSISRGLCYGIAQCVAKVHHRPFALYHTPRRPKTTIEGREVNQHDSYEVVWKLSNDKQDKAFYEDGYIWYPLNKEPELIEDNLPVFNLSVDEDESYTANGAIAHNCQDISNAGVQRGFEKGSNTRSSLLWECERAIEYKRPKYLLMENVKALTQKKFMPDFNKWLQLLESYGYVNSWSVLNSKNFGVPQNRERVFCVSIRDDGDNPKYHFPNPFPLEICLADILEEEVDEKYFLRDEMLARFCEKSQDNDPEQKEIDFEEWLV